MNQKTMSKQTITDVIIHTHTELDEEYFSEVSKQVYREQGIVSFNRNARTPRCFMVVYNAAQISAKHILETVTGTGVKASLVGI